MKSEPFLLLKRFTVSLLFLHIFKCIKKIFVASSHNPSQNISKYASDIGHAITFERKGRNIK